MFVYEKASPSLTGLAYLFLILMTSAAFQRPANRAGSFIFSSTMDLRACIHTG